MVGFVEAPQIHGGGLISGMQIARAVQEAQRQKQAEADQNALKEAFGRAAKGDKNAWADIARYSPELYLKQKQFEESKALEREKLAQQKNGGAWTTDLGRMWSIANDPNQTPENRQMATQYLQYTARNPLANQGWNYAGRMGTLQADLGLGGQVEAQKRQGQQQGEYYGKEWEDQQKGWGYINGEKRALKGSQAEQEYLKANDQALKNNEVVTRAGQTVLDDIKAVKRLAKENPWLASGIGASMVSGIPGTTAADIASRVESIKGNIAVDSLLNIKKSGAGLGQVPQKQAEMLSGLLGNLSQKQSPTEFVDVLDRIEKIYGGIVEAANKENKDIMSKIYDPQGQRVKQQKEENIVDWSEL